jgi:hypothetical protein
MSCLKRYARASDCRPAAGRDFTGARGGDLETVRRIGVKKWINQQLNPKQIPESPELEARLRPLDSLTMSQRELLEAYPTRRVTKSLTDSKAPKQLVRGLYEQKLYRAVYSSRQLEEVLTDHFNVYFGKGAIGGLCVFSIAC